MSPKGLLGVRVLALPRKAADMVVEDKAVSESLNMSKAGYGGRTRKRGNYADNMQNEIRASNAALMAQRKAKKRLVKAKEHERLLKMNIQKTHALKLYRVYPPFLKKMEPLQPGIHQE